MSCIMQARSSSTGAMVSWSVETPDWAGAHFPGPGTAQDIAVSAAEVVGGGGGDGSGSLPVLQIFGSNAAYSAPDEDAHYAVATYDIDSLTILLPENPTSGRRIEVKWVDGRPENGNPVTIDGNGKNIDGASTYVLPHNYGAVTLVFNGGEDGTDSWGILGGQSAFDNASDVGITDDGKLALNKTAGDVPDEGDVRIAGGGVDGAGFIPRARGIDSDGTTTRDIGLGFFYTSDFGGSIGIQNVIGMFGDWEADAAKSPDLVLGYFGRAWSLAYTTPTAEGDNTGIGLDSWTSGAPPIPDYSHRRAFFLERHTNFVLYGTRDHLLDVEEALGNGEGVAYLGRAEVAPTTNPTQGVTFWCSAADVVTYRRPNGNIVALDGGLRPRSATITQSDTSDTTLSATQAENPILVATGSPGGSFNWIVPNTAGNRYEVTNETDGALTIKKSGGTGVTIAAGKSAIVRHNGTDYIRITPDA